MYVCMYIYICIILNIFIKVIYNAFLSPLCIKFPQMNTYAKYFDKNKCMNLWWKLCDKKKY